MFTQHTSLAEKQEMSFDIIFTHSICFMEITFCTENFFLSSFSRTSSSTTGTQKVTEKKKTNENETSMETMMISQTTFSVPGCVWKGRELMLAY